jgi:sulfhydrogenase subunit beta (sulfur reductase)
MKNYRKIPKGRVENLVRELEKNFEVIAPVKNGDRVFFKELTPGDDIDLKSNPTNSPKEFFLPFSETLFEFREEGGRLEISQNIKFRERVLFGIRPCDIQSLLFLDLIASGDFKDPYYMRRREKTVLVALSCLEPLDGCFCTSFGGGPSLDKGADLLLTDIGDYFLAESFTAEGEEIIKSKLFEDASERDGEMKDKRVREAEEKIQKLELEKILEGLFDDKFWDSLSGGCVSCAVCAFLCPTCYCFDVVDDERISTAEGRRVRCWDTCMSPSFTRLAGGENPRALKRDRLRQRIYHKFNYIPERFGVFGCVGCGRCIRYCPAGIDVREVVSQVK